MANRAGYPIFKPLILLTFGVPSGKTALLEPQRLFTEVSHAFPRFVPPGLPSPRELAGDELYDILVQLIMRPILAAIIGLALATAPAVAETVRAIDGDTIALDGTRYRLWGIDSPESAQTCTKDAQPWPCGAQATAALTQLMAGKTIACEFRALDRYGRTVALCRAGGVDLSAAMVEAGMAVAFRRYSLDYVPQENVAREARRGIWQGEFTMPWDFRAAKKAGQ